MGSIELMPEWQTIEMKGIEKLKKCIEGVPDQQFSSQDYMLLYTCVYSMCTTNLPNDHEEQLYNKYRETIEEYITSTVLPSLDGKNDEFLLRELVKRWGNHRVMVRWLSRFFHFLDRYYVIKQNLPPLHKVGFTCFRDLVYNDINGKVRDVVISLIDQEREGEQIDGALLKNVVDFFVEVGMGHTDCYENDFEAQMLLNTAAYYSRKASIWILEYSGPDYRRKAEECLKQEKDRVANYLQPSSEQKLLERVEHELLNVHGKQLSEDEHSGSHA